jgi:exo-beta-1,3-glucanase (GH17 family)
LPLHHHLHDLLWRTHMCVDPMALMNDIERETNSNGNVAVAVIQPASQKPVVAAPPPVESSPPPASVYPSSSTAYRDSVQPSASVPPPETSTPTPKPTGSRPYPETAPELAPTPERTLKPSATPATSKPHQSASPPIGSNSSHWCITYSPYNGDGSCKDSTSVFDDIALIASKGFTSVRLYSTDCSGLHHVGAAVKSHGLKLVLGIYISESGIGDAEAQITDIVAWTGGDWGCVEMIVVGNEALFNGYSTPDALVGFINKAKSAFSGAGYSGPITTAEPINVLKEHAASLCPILDIVGANIHPFFNSDVTAETAGDFVARELQFLQEICPGLPSYNLETGWPSAGSANGAALPGVSEQQAAIVSILNAAGSHSVFFSFVDDLWKEEGQFGV